MSDASKQLDVYVGFDHGWNVQSVGVRLSSDVDLREYLASSSARGSVLVSVLQGDVLVDHRCVFPVVSMFLDLTESRDVVATLRDHCSRVGIEESAFPLAAAEDVWVYGREEGVARLASSCPTPTELSGIASLTYICPTWTDGERLVGRPAGAVTFLDRYTTLVDEIWWFPPLPIFVTPGGGPPVAFGLRLGEPEVRRASEEIRGTHAGMFARATGRFVSV